MEKQPLEMLLLKRSLKNTTKSIGEDPRRYATPTNPQCSFNEVALQRGHKTTLQKSTPKELRPFIFKNPN